MFVSLCQHFLRTWSCNNVVRKHQITMVLCQYLISIQSTVGLCDQIFISDSWIFTLYEPSGLHSLNPLGHKVFGFQNIMTEKEKQHWKFSCQKILSFLSYHYGPECPPGYLNIINSSLRSIAVKLFFYKMNHHDKGHMKLWCTHFKLLCIPQCHNWTDV